MSKSRIYWLLAALVFFLIMLGSAISFLHEKPLKAVEYPAQEQVTQSLDSKEKININTADKEKLKDLDGIDKSKAQAIIDYRKEHGDFISVDEILKVNGIGTKTYIKIKDKICV